MKREVLEKASTIFADLDRGGGCLAELFGNVILPETIMGRVDLISGRCGEEGRRGSDLG